MDVHCQSFFFFFYREIQLRASEGREKKGQQFCKHKNGFANVLWIHFNECHLYTALNFNND